MGEILVGTASWADKSLVDSKLFYPKGAYTAELRYYETSNEQLAVHSGLVGFVGVRLDKLAKAITRERVKSAAVAPTPANKDRLP